MVTPSQPSYTLKRSCSELTVGDYIQLVCYGKKERLIASGTPPEQELLLTQAEVLYEYAMLSGQSNGGHVLMHYQLAMQNRIKLIQAHLAAHMFPIQPEDAIDWLKKSGMTNALRLLKMDAEKAMAAIIGHVKLLTIRVEEDVTKTAKTAAKNKGKKITEKDIRLEIALVGGDGVIGDDCSLATYAGKVNAFRLRQEQLKQRNDGKK